MADVEHQDELYMRVFGLPQNDTVYDVDRDAVYGFSYNIDGRGWMSQICSWDFAYGMYCGVGICNATTDSYTSCALFLLDNDRQPKAVISKMRLPAWTHGTVIIGNERIYTNLTILADDVESLKFEVK